MKGAVEIVLVARWWRSGGLRLRETVFSGQGKIHVFLHVPSCMRLAEGDECNGTWLESREASWMQDLNMLLEFRAQREKDSYHPEWLTVGDNGTHQPQTVVHWIPVPFSWCLLFSFSQLPSFFCSIGTLILRISFPSTNTCSGSLLCQALKPNSKQGKGRSSVLLLYSLGRNCNTLNWYDSDSLLCFWLGSR